MRMLSLCSSDRFNITLDDGLLLRGISDTRAVSVYLVRHFVHITHYLVFLRTYCCQPSFMGTSQIAWVTVHIGPTTAGVILDVASGDTGDIAGAICILVQHRLLCAATRLSFTTKLGQHPDQRFSYCQRHTHAYV